MSNVGPTLHRVPNHSDQLHLDTRHAHSYNAATIGEVPEWTNGAVSKTVVAPRATVSSNLTLSADKALTAKSAKAA